MSLTKKKILLRYLPKSLSRKDKRKQKNMLFKSRRLYKKSVYYSRKPLKSFKSKKSTHITDAQKLYKIDKVVVNSELSKKTGCTKKSLEKIVNKGEGAYYSSGSRPNQTAQSWGIARLASAITGGKASYIDFSILENGCREKDSIALKLAKKAKAKYMKKTRKMPKTI
jgi:DNA-binding Xre family transcriptional regulator